MQNIIDGYSSISPEKVGTRWEGTRAEKEVRYYNFHENKKGLTLKQKERFSIDLLKMALTTAKKPVVSCSFGIDSILTLYLARKAMQELGRNHEELQVVWNDTLNEFPETRVFAKQLKDQWQLNLVVTRPEKVLKKVIEENGGITSDYFTARKGSRKEGQPLSEKCCNHLKHKPMRKAIKQGNWDLIINGLRADESTQRLRAGLRDGEYFYSSKEWKARVCRPILWFNELEVWEYIFQENVPYNPVYDNNYIVSYASEKDITENAQEIMGAGLQVSDLLDKKIHKVNKKQYLVLKAIGFDVNRAVRVGCMACPIPIKYGYLEWIRIFYPKVYKAMVFNLGYGKAMLGMLSKEVQAEIKAFTGIDVTEENAHEYLKEILEAKPCTFDKFNI